MNKSIALSLALAAVVFTLQGCASNAPAEKELFPVKDVTEQSEAAHAAGEHKCGGANGCGADMDKAAEGEHKCGGEHSCGADKH
jgi:uncharacterized low-complexity protein